MAYTLLNQYGEPQRIRLVMAMQDEVKIGQPFTPAWWRCDPCNVSSKRYEVEFSSNAKPQYYAWYEVILSDDDEETIKVKTDFAAKVTAASQVIDDARREYHKLTGEWR